MTVHAALKKLSREYRQVLPALLGTSQPTVVQAFALVVKKLIKTRKRDLSIWAFAFSK